MSKTILYIHGYNGHGSTGVFLEEALKEYDIKVIHPTIPDDYNKARKLIDDILAKEQVDLVLGTSLGGYMTLNTKNVKRIAINPCMMPNIEICLLDEKGIDIAKTYNPTYKHISEWDKENTYGVFGEQDKLIDYRGMFNAVFGNRKMISIPDAGHKLTQEQFREYVFPLIFELL